MSYCPTHGSYQATTAGYCPQCGSHARLVATSFTVVPTIRTSDLAAENERLRAALVEIRATAIRIHGPCGWAALNLSCGCASCVVDRVLGARPTGSEP